MLEIDNLRGAHFGPITLTLNALECVVVQGVSGAGKTLFLRAVADMDCVSGDVRIGGCCRRDLSPPEWRRRVGLLPAESQWWADTVGMHFAKGAAATIAPLGFGPETLNWQVARLSSGERQRLALARLLSNRPRVLLLDEPTANLDEINRGRVEALVADYLKVNHACALWVSHDVAQAARITDRVVRMADGRLQAPSH
ncbi:MAG: ATP-binding cassette domain-containing protein [Gammaproteobacteria bacterium]|nr:ATP-binding cassette domain-containing protein [Gammaproteobacteria bacterium]